MDGRNGQEKCKYQIFLLTTAAGASGGEHRAFHCILALDKRSCEQTLNYAQYLSKLLLLEATSSSQLTGLFLYIDIIEVMDRIHTSELAEVKLSRRFALVRRSPLTMSSFYLDCGHVLCKSTKNCRELRI